jgi:hypothetical protein
VPLESGKIKGVKCQKIGYRAFETKPEILLFMIGDQKLQKTQFCLTLCKKNRFLVLFGL